MPDPSRTVARLFHYLTAQPHERRATFLADIGTKDAELERELRSLLDGWAATRTSSTSIAPRDPGAPSVCSACRSPIALQNRFCSVCGTPVGVHAFEGDGPFRTGSLFASRFRIVSKLGEGGMGIVYRAHDLTLDQPVAVKVISDSKLGSPAVARARLRSEVRLARQITHPNVCRVYDIGESGDILYVSMEYVDGEDLASLLARIGRLPVDKGMDVARKLCAGVAAAHARDVLHRDLKPRNIMIDAHGEVRIMDFGLAVVPSQLDPADIATGTPMYMAPEQLAGEQVTRQSDLYALGLVLYELFTGKRPFDAKSLTELLRQRETSDITLPSRHVAGLGGELDRLIVQCLDPNPRKRPPSVLHVAAALPLGDPLGDAIAAGETPAPSVVAAAGLNEALRPATAIALLVTAATGLALVCAITPRVQIAGRVPLSNPPAALAARADDLARALGYGGSGAYVAAGFRYDAEQVEYLPQRMPNPGQARNAAWTAALSRAPYPLSFSYTEGDRRVIVPGPQEPLIWTQLLPTDVAAPSVSTVSIRLDLDGRLLRFASSRPPLDSETAAGRAVDWVTLFDAAGLEFSRFTTANATTLPPAMSDHQIAWTGTYLTGREPVRIEAASYAGSVVLFEILFPWTPPADQPRAPLPQPDLLLLALLALIAIVAAHNWRVQRGDPRGAWRLGIYTSCGYALSLALTVEADILPGGLWTPLAFSLSFGLVVATVYLALEPWVRRLWPHALITWARVLAGRWRDAVVGRDVLVGVACAAMNAALQRVAQLAAVIIGAPPVPPVENGATFAFYLGNLASDRLMVADRLMSFVKSLDVLMFFFVVFIARVVLKRQWRATIAYLLFWHLVLSSQHAIAGEWLAVIYWTIELSVLLLLTLRFGLLATVVFGTCSILITRGVLTPDLTAWYGRSSALTVLTVITLATLAFRVSLGGRPLWDPAALERNALARAS
jgi:serine/threonine-protein kinase